MLLRAALLLILSVTVVFAQDANDRVYQSIRNNDLVSLRTLIKEQGAVTSDASGQTSLMFAAAIGSFDAMQLLIDAGANANAVSSSGLTALHLCTGDIKKVRLLVDHGADVNARSQMGRTPLLVAAYTHGASETVRLLLSHRADFNKADATGITPLIASASVNDTTTAKLLIERGADIDARANVPAAATALMAAAHNGNEELTRLLLARKASVQAVSSPVGVIVKNGPVQFGSVTALHMGALGGSAAVVRMLLDAGALVDALDVRGMTPLMWSVSTDRPNVPIVSMLLQKGSDPSAQSKTGESTFDWARKFNNPAVMAELKSEAHPNTNTNLPVGDVTMTAQAAVERSIPLLQSSGVRMFTDGGCIACHAQALNGLAMKLARSRGWNVSDSVAAESLQALKALWNSADQPLLQGLEAGPGVDAMVYNSMMLAALEEKPTWKTDVLVHYLAAKQRIEGNWHGIGASRAPLQDGDFSRTAMSIRALVVYGMPGRRAEIDERVQRGAKWLAAQTPLTTEDRAMQLLGLKWANTHADVRETRTRELIAQQRADGGWAQTPYLASDAYAAGQVLYTLHELGVSSTHAAFSRGADYLLKTQKEDGSWYVKSRAMKVQPYFESGFPYGHDQWVSSAATAWAVMALALTSPESPAVAAVLPAR